MDETSYVRQVAELVVGKKLPGAVYLHRSLIKELPPALVELTNGIDRALKLAEGSWNVLKFHSDQFKLSFLHYPEFESDPYPALRISKVVDLSRKTVRDMDFSDDSNPPILHRKELLVPSDHPGRDDFVQATQEGEDAGLYKSPRGIGFRRNWMALIDASGYELVDGRLFRKSAMIERVPRATSYPASALPSVERDSRCQCRCFRSTGFSRVNIQFATMGAAAAMTSQFLATLELM